MKFNLISTSASWRGLTPAHFNALDKYGFTYTRISNESEIYDSCIIEINDLDELLKLSKKFGEIILSASLDPNELADIEIYDSYRE